MTRTYYLLFAFFLIGHTAPQYAKGETRTYYDDNTVSLRIISSETFERDSGIISIELIPPNLLFQRVKFGEKHQVSYRQGTSSERQYAIQGDFVYVRINRSSPGNEKSISYPSNWTHFLIVGKREEVTILVSDTGLTVNLTDSHSHELQRFLFEKKPDILSCARFDEGCFLKRERAYNEYFSMLDSVQSDNEGRIDSVKLNHILSFYRTLATFSQLSFLYTLSKSKSSASERYRLTSESYHRIVGRISEIYGLTSNGPHEGGYYWDFLFYKELLSCKFDNSMEEQNEIFHERLLESIKLKYKGDELNRLLAYHVAFIYRKNILDVSDAFINSIYASIGPSEIKDRMKEVISSRVYGHKMHPFSLTDSVGTVHTLASYSGKVLLMDYWFAECSPCKILAERLRPVVDRFNHHNQFQFLSVNVDADRNQWKTALNRPPYSQLKGIHLNTNGSGLNEESIKALGFFGFPQLLIIDKSGGIVTTRAPRPNSNEGRVELERMLSDLLD